MHPGERIDDLARAALERNRDEWVARMRRMGSCPCKQSGRPIARFRSNPSGSGLFGRSAALRRLSIGGLSTAHRALHPIPKRPLRDPWEIANRLLVFKEWVKGSHVRLERNPHYWQKGQPYLQGIVFKFIPDAAARAVALEVGEIDVALGSSIPLSNLERFSDPAKWTINLDDGRYLSTIFLTQFNVRRPYLSDKRVRQAFAHAIDKNALLKVVFWGYGKPATGPVPSSVVNYYSPDTRQYPYDLKKAEALLDEAGFRKGADGKRLKVTLDYDGGGGGNREAEFIRQSLGRIGVEVVLRGGDTVSYLRRIFTDQDYDLMISSLHRLPDPTLGVQRLFWTRNIIKGAPWTNGSGYSNPALDKIMEAAADEANPTRRKALITQWQQIVQEDLPVLDLIEQTWVTVSTARFHKTVAQGDGLFASYADAWLQPAAGK